jgi:multidrug efflux pump subunit AcrA (membrane-fusion protein)
MVCLRQKLWGAPAPAPEPKGRFLTLFGLASWAFSLVFMALMLGSLARWLGDHLGPPAVACVALFGITVVYRMFRGTAGGEIKQMLRRRRWRTIAWLGALTWGGSALCFWEIEDRAGGEFQLRSAVRAEIRAPLAGFLREVCVAEGQPVSPGTRILRLEVPELNSQLARKQAELAEADAGLCLLEAGTRPEELLAQRQRIDSARTWRDIALKNRDQAREALTSQLAGLDGDIARAQAEWDAARENLSRAKTLHAQQAISSKDFEAAQLRLRAAQAACDKAAADKRSVESRGVLLVELELAERNHDLASLESALTVMEAGSRPEEINAQQARVNRLREELRELEERQRQLVVCSPVGGLVTTHRFCEKVGSHFQAGDLILLVEDPSSLEAEIRLDEQAVRRVHNGQTATLRPRAVPLEKVSAVVRRVADAAVPAEAAGSASRVHVNCILDRSTERLRPGMSGYARIDTGRRPVGAILIDRLLQNLKTEYWW